MSVNGRWHYPPCQSWHFNHQKKSGLVAEPWRDAGRRVFDPADSEGGRNLLHGLVRGPPTIVDTQAITKIGNIDAEVISIVKEQSMDLVVMGTHGRRQVGRWLMGSVTERMLRRVPVAVVTVSRIDDGRHLVNPSLALLKHILYAADWIRCMQRVRFFPANSQIASLKRVGDLKISFRE